MKRMKLMTLGHHCGATVRRRVVTKEKWFRMAAEGPSLKTEEPFSSLGAHSLAEVERQGRK